MSLPHQTGLDRAAGGRPDSHAAAAAHAREWDAIMHPIPKITKARKVVYISLPVLAVLSALVWFWSKTPDPYTVDTSTPRGALGAYIAALDRRERWAAADLLCDQGRQSLIAQGFLHTTATVVRDHALEPDPALIWDAELKDNGLYVVEASVDGLSEAYWVVPEGDGQYRVCGFARGN